MESTKTLQSEHNAVLCVLDQLERAAIAAVEGQPVPKDVFTDIEEFFRVFVDRCHHAKEETVLFPRLAGSHLALQLEEEHAETRELAQAYAAAVRAYVPGNRASGSALHESAAHYAAALAAHIAKENAELLPAVEAALSTEDRELAEAFERIETERIGAGTHERLHGMIATLAGRIEPFLRAKRWRNRGDAKARHVACASPAGQRS
jgi:hemerythrin-like domain-containing protein